MQNVNTLPFSHDSISSSQLYLAQIEAGNGVGIEIVEFLVSFSGVTAINTPCLIQTHFGVVDYSLIATPSIPRLEGMTIENVTSRTNPYLVSPTDPAQTSHYTDPNGRCHVKFERGGPTFIGEEGIKAWGLSASSQTVPLPASGFVSWRYV